MPKYFNIEKITVYLHRRYIIGVQCRSLVNGRHALALGSSAQGVRVRVSAC